MKNKTILIFGGTGALGKTLIKRYYNKNKIIVFSRDEHKHVDLMKEYSEIESHLGDIRDKDSIINCLSKFKPNVVINTAALKHVPICETNSIESVKTNILGHQNVIESVREFKGIETLIFISTDKACKPINIYGMCKAISEKLYSNYAETETGTKVVTVRYGNVLESTGSVIPYFKQLLKDGSDYLPITHSDMTRFLITLDDAVELIHWAYNHPSSHGKIAVPKIKSMRMVDLAKCLIKKHSDDQDIELKTIGIRAGEKLHEEMISEEEWFRTEEHENYLINNHQVNSNIWSYNSKDTLMSEDEAYNFLKNSGVI
jgi:FlaA1/EpsC-like NDP-sugar epimerase|tara:strand:+ start:94 stop:1038 length:945 start_codon:yes stop_codon:yes gene_type:complete